ncbi:unnamed protein product [Paramecium pentaurelia]|uniref:Transmembrane protein n=1 Tax=Paramecium pentaurelia TaxID=43138 RepID=A0A8S1VY86_9CILI|nr:unnamed protein product [Paramecium pentaurelia]
MMFFNCEKSQNSYKSCHFSCLECDGPTKHDCLTCDYSQNRIYLEEYKVCLCIYGTTDLDNQCIDYSTYGINIIEKIKQEFKCSYGYFEFENNCWKCPSTIRDNLIKCVDCIINPKTWIYNPYCQYDFVTDNTQSPYIKIDYEKVYYTFDGMELKVCEHCDSIPNIYQDYMITQNRVYSFCQNCNFESTEYQNTQDRFSCFFFENCQNCEINISQPQCTQCRMNYVLKDGICQFYSIQNTKQQICDSPNYINFNNICILCPIQNCRFCFEYLRNDHKKNTLFIKQQFSTIEEEILIGCAECLKGYIFDFTIGQCIYQQTKLNNCLRSYINQQNEELCTLSSINDFTVAPEISNCQNILYQCKQCVQTPQYIQKCIICEEGYSSSLNTGICQLNQNLPNTKYGVLWPDSNIWSMLVQSFTILFMQNTPGIYNSINRLINFSVECLDGYEIIGQKCMKYCDKNCQKCLIQDSLNKFTCTLCSLNYYQQPYRVQDNGKCIVCPPLCLVCQERSIDSILNINPYFIINETNIQYTTYCVQSIQNSNVFVDPYLQIAQYSYSDEIQKAYEYPVLWLCSGDSTIFELNNLDSSYFNQIGLQQFILKMQLQNPCGGREIINNLKTTIFSLQIIKLQFTGILLPLALDNTLNFSNFDQVEFSNLQIKIKDVLKFIFFNRGMPIDFIIQNTSFYSNKLSSTEFKIQFDVYQIFHMYNISIFDANFNNIIIFKVNSTNLNEDILIDLFFLTNCTFNNTVLFSFKTTQKKLVIQNLFIDQCQFYNSLLFSFNQDIDYQSTIIIQSITIKNSQFNNSQFIQSYDKNKLSILFFQMIENKIENSQLLRISNDFSIFNLLIKQNFFIESILIEKLFSNSYENKLIINEIQVISNIFQNFQVLVINEIKIPYLIELKNLDFKDNINPQMDIQEYLFQLSSSILKIQNVFLLNTINLRYFSLFNITTINIENITIENELQQHRIPLQQYCLINQQFHSKLLFLQGFQSIYMSFIILKNQISMDQSLIEILSNVEIGTQKTEKIFIENVNVTRNILLRTNQGNVFSIISIFSEKVQQINLQNIFFSENSYHQYMVDLTLNSASLLFISSLHSYVLIQDIKCLENSLTNSSNSFIKISSNQITIISIKISNHNYIRKEFWNEFYELQLQDNLNEIEVNYMIQQVLSFQNNGGALQIYADTFTIENSLFLYIIAESSFALNIITKGNGFVTLSNLYISNCQNNLFLNSEREGSISINSKNSYLTLIIQNFTLKNLYNKLAPSILSIQSSDIKNDISIKNGQILNCFSLKNSFVAFLFNPENANQNQVSIENILIEQNEQDLLFFNSQLELLDLITLSKITQDNAIFNILGCNLKIKKLTFNGIVQSSIFKLINCVKLLLFDINFDEVTIFYNLKLIHIEQDVQFKSLMQIHNVHIQHINIFNNKNYKFQIIYPNFFIDYKSCKIQKLVSQLNKNQQIEKLFNNFEQIQFYSTQNGSIFEINCSNNETKIYLKQIILNNHECQFCKNGLIFLQLVDFTQIRIEEFLCIGNIINSFGCITASSDQKTKGKLFVFNSFFINNSGSQGIALSSINVKTILQNLKILNNTAILIGGGLFLDLTSDEFQIKFTIISNNKAREGGGIYLNGDSTLNQINFHKSLLVLNQAQLQTNNLQELPSHLDLSINFQTLLSNKQIIEQKQISQLKLNPYRIIEQGKSFMANQLMIPSNQEILKYQIYYPKYLKYISYITEFSISFKNRFNEQLLNFSDSSCLIVQSTFDINTLEKLGSTNISLIEFNQITNNFNLGTLIFSMNPYNQSALVFKISAFCKAKNYTEELQYDIIIKGLVCQLGEFYHQNGCSTCQDNQGFYSVTYNATKCSIFDKSKFEAITSNNINLKLGFWRPHYLSDIIVDCFKSLQSCKGGWTVGDDTCIIGHIGGLCEECDKYNIRGDGYYFKNDQNISCLNCNYNSANILSVILIALWAIISTLITLRSVEKTNQAFMQLKINQKFSNILFKLNFDQESILLKLYLNYLWIFSLIFTFNIQFSFSFIFVNKMSDTSYFMTRNLDCQIIQSFKMELIYSRVIVMITLIIILILIIQSGISIFSIITKVKFHNNILSITLLYLYIQNFAAIINQLLSIVAKRQISNIDYVQGDVSLLFQTQHHYSWIVKFAIPISMILGFILPIVLLCFLYFNKEQFNKIKFRRHIGYLINEYRKNRFFWEWIKLWKKTTIIIILIYFETNVLLKGFLIVVCLMIYQFMTYQYQPYIYEKLNKLDLQTGQLCSLAIILAAVKYNSEQESDNFSAGVLQIVIILLSIGFSYPYIFKILQVYYQKYKEQFIMLLIVILTKLSPKQNLIFKFTNKLNLWKQKQDRIKRNFNKMRFQTILKKRFNNKDQIQMNIPNTTQYQEDQPQFKFLISQKE